MLGTFTDILSVVARHRAIRFATLYEYFHENRVRAIRTNDRAGLTMSWQLPFGSKRGQRGNAIALDPEFPLYGEVRAVLRALGREFPFQITSDVSVEEVQSAPHPRRYHPDALFASKPQLRILIAVDMLGRSATVNTVRAIIPGLRESVAAKNLRRFVDVGILVKDGPYVRFPEAAWVKPYRALLRRLSALDEHLVKGIKQRHADLKAARARRNDTTLFGRKIVQRTLITLALDGPLKTGDLEHATFMKMPPHTLDKLYKAGIVVKKCVAKSGDVHSDYNLIGLNAAHPIYRELRALLAAMAGEPPSKKPPLRIQRSEPFTLNGLFMTSLRLNVLVSVAPAVHGEIDATIVSGLVPQHEILLIYRWLAEWTQQGLLLRRRGGPMMYYRFNPDHAYAPALKRLLEKIGATWSDFKEHAALETDLYVERRAVMERSLGRRKREDIE